jgi:hypothetical protein
MIPPYHFIILGLAVWRVAVMLVDEDGPGNIFGWMRSKLVRESAKETPGSLSQGLSCVYCLSVWLSLVVFVAYVAQPVVTLYTCIPLALAALCAVLQQLTYDRTDDDDPETPPESLDE